MILDFIAYVLAGFLWGLFWRNILVNVIVVYIFQLLVYLGIGLTVLGYTSLEFWLYAPLLFLGTSVLGIIFGWIFKCPYFYKKLFIGAEPMFIKLVVQFVILHLVLIFGDLILPWSGVAMCFMYICLIALFLFVNRHDHVWLRVNNIDGKMEYVMSKQAIIFYCEWMFVFVVPIIVYTLVAWLASSLWQLWVCLIVIGVMAGLMLLLGLLHWACIIPTDKDAESTEEFTVIAPYPFSWGDRGKLR